MSGRTRERRRDRKRRGRAARMSRFIGWRQKGGNDIDDKWTQAKRRSISTVADIVLRRFAASVLSEELGEPDPRSACQGSSSSTTGSSACCRASTSASSRSASTPAPSRMPASALAPRPCTRTPVLYSTERGRRVEGVVEVETGESINHLEAMAQWAAYGRSKCRFTCMCL